MIPTSPAPKIPANAAVPGGPLERWWARLHSGLVGEVAGRPETYVKDALYLDACAEALALQQREGYGRQR